MKIADISERYNELEDTVEDSPNDYFDWKGLKSSGYTHILLDGSIYTFSKYGPSQKIAKIDKVN
ncbi:hypothetical protein NCTGTJJY_CDS0266 [Serratia phage 92A1]|nr:hypothetical protein NCTGTJJY_CDS0266 [Serratia phage 92A1]